MLLPVQTLQHRHPRLDGLRVVSALRRYSSLDVRDSDVVMSEYIIDMGHSSYKSQSGLLSADVSQLREEIVRCRDCKYLCDDGSTWGCGWHCSCLTTNDGTPPEGFCAWGERMESW